MALAEHDGNGDPQGGDALGESMKRFEALQHIAPAESSAKVES